MRTTIRRTPAAQGRRGPQRGFTLIEPFGSAHGKLHAVRKGKCEAFTLIELLVVVAILVLLMAILSPSLRWTQELARRATCASNLHQFTIVSRVYANDSRGVYMVHSPVAPYNKFHYGIWHRTDNVYRGIGLLYRDGRLKETKFAYCPSWRHPYIQPGQWDPTGNWGGWPTPADSPKPTAWIKTSYHYRSSYRGPGDDQPFRIFRGYDPGHLAVFADHWSDHLKPDYDGLGEGMYGHGVGYNVAYLDGRVEWVGDPDGEIILLGISKGAPGQMESKVWRVYFDR